MTGWLVIAAVAIVGTSGIPGALLDRRSLVGERIATFMMVMGATCGIAAAALALVVARADAPAPGLALGLRIDAIAAMFLVQIFVIAALCAVYGLGYWAQIDRPADGRKLRLFYGLVTAGLALLVSARSSILFLVGWEVMALAAFFLITTEDEIKETRESGFVYLIATRVGMLLLLALFTTLHALRGTFDFAAPNIAASSKTATVLFFLALLGFGLKAGLMPLHLWLPGAHANAPSHVSALMSGVVIKTGIYGLIRFTSFFPQPPMWWGLVLLGAGTVSGVLGVAFAIGQHDLKRLRAYHSVENVGIIVMGLGLAVIGRAVGRPELLVLGLAGALLHTWNHGLFKALLFLSAGSAIHATGTRAIDRLGGLARSMPRTSGAFVVGAVAICGLPPLNGFVSELFVYLGLFHAAQQGDPQTWIAGALGAPALALIGGLALACFVKVLGAVFLGEPRTDDARHAHESPRTMTTPMAVLAGCCVLIGIAPFLVAPVLDRAVTAWAPEAATVHLASVAPLRWVSVAGVGLLAIIALLASFLARSTRGRSTRSLTWDCGYAAPTARMQYTSSSFADSIVSIFAWALRPSRHAPDTRALFPDAQHFHAEVPDVVLDRLVLPGARNVARGAAWFRWMQQGSLHVYLLYILATLIVLMLFR
jgi:hydrogenase-4 component B